MRAKLNKDWYISSSQTQGIRIHKGEELELLTKEPYMSDSDDGAFMVYLCRITDGSLHEIIVDWLTITSKEPELVDFSEMKISGRFRNSLAGVYDIIKFVQDYLPSEARIRMEREYLAIELGKCNKNNSIFLTIGEKIEMVDDKNYIVTSNHNRVTKYRTE